MDKVLSKTFIVPPTPSPSKQAVANPDEYFRYTTSFILHNFAYNCNSSISFIDNLVTYQIYWNDSSIRQLFNLKNVMSKIHILNYCTCPET